MAELTETLIASTEFAGKFKLILVRATPGSASDTIVLTEAQTGCTELAGVIGATLTAGADAALQSLQVAVSSMTITITSFNEAGTAATDWTGASVDIAVLGKTSA